MRCGITISVMAILAGCHGSGIEGYTLTEPDVTDLVPAWDFRIPPDDALEQDGQEITAKDLGAEEIDVLSGAPFLAPCDEDSDCESGSAWSTSERGCAGAAAMRARPGGHASRS